MATDFSFLSDPSGVFGPATGALEGLEALNAAGFVARLTDEQPRGPYRRYTTGAPLELVQTLPGYVPGSESVTVDKLTIRPGAAAVLERAYAYAEAIVEADGAVDLDQLGVGQTTASRERLLAHALVIAGERFAALEMTYFCQWCLDVARGAVEHLALKAYTRDEVRVHGPRCEHNPLARAVRAHLAALEGDGGTPAPSPTELALRALVEVGS